MTADLTPNLYALRQAGTWYPNARSLPVMETIPNHVMMMTGVRPDRSGVPANAVFDRLEGAVRDLDRATDLRFPTVIERLNAAGYCTGTVLSKKYLYGIFGTRATYRWEPSPLVPVTNHAPDAFTTDALISMVDSVDPDLVFTNLGDIDRVGHSDLTGSTTLEVARTAALASTDQQVGRFVQHLKDTGSWETSVLVVLADHSMDWSVPARVVSLASALDADPLLTGRVQIAQNGGADLLYWTGAAADREAAVRPDPRDRRGAWRACCRPTPADRPEARPGGRRPGRLLQGGLAVQRPGRSGRTRSPATTATRSPSRSRSSSRAARDAWPSARCAPMWRTPSTSRRRSGSCSGSLRPRAATTGPPASSRFVEPVPAEARFSGERHPTGTR